MSFLKNDKRHAYLTPQERKQYTNALGYKYSEPYAFGWLRTLGVNAKNGYDVFHVCVDGTLNGLAHTDSSHQAEYAPQCGLKNSRKKKDEEISSFF